MCGLRSEATQKKQLTEAHLTFQRAVEIAQSMEAAFTKSRHTYIHESMSNQSTSWLKPAKVCKVGLPSQLYMSIHSCYKCAESQTTIQDYKVSLLWQGESHQSSV